MDGVDGIDLNCGCPVPKVIKQGAGSALLRDLPKLSRLLSIIKKHSNKRYTSAKVRLGFDTKIPKEIAKVVQEAGADFITIHGRTRSGGYRAKVDYEAIKEAKKTVEIPVIANGDIKSYEDYKTAKEITGCNSAMIGRGSIGKPWIFTQIKQNADEIDKEIKKRVILRHFELLFDFYQERAASIFRKHLHLYSKGYPNASEFRDRVNRIDDYEKLCSVIEEFFSA
jgi:tRNA-dihydrouridine synthase B